MAVVYKLTREDGLSYIGIAKDFQTRYKEHVSSRRFSKLKIKDYEILFEGDWSECDLLEEKYIKDYGTYKHGLNCTPTGKGKNPNCKFNTYGFVFSEESKQKISNSMKGKLAGVKNPMYGKHHSEATKVRWSELRKGISWRPLKIDPEKLREDFGKFSPTIEDWNRYCCKKSQISEERNENSYIGKGGRPLTKRILFAHIYAPTYKVSKAGILKSMKHNEI